MKRPSGSIGSERGFTLIELLIVLTVVGILVTIAQPSLKQSIFRAKEAVLREDLFQMREALDQYYADNAKYPGRLEDLVGGSGSSDRSRSYLREIPKDPFTGSANWVTVNLDGDDGGIFDVHSASPLLGVDGTAYNTW